AGEKNRTGVENARRRFFTRLVHQRADQPLQRTQVIAILLLSLFSELHWRPIGPIRGGRTKAAAGVPQRPGTFYIGPVNGGVFRTDDYGRTWTPIFDDQPSASIGAIAVAPSNPDITYVGSGDGLQRPDLPPRPRL